MTSNQEPALDEVVWRAPQLAQQMGGIHTNTSAQKSAPSISNATDENSSTLLCAVPFLRSDFKQCHHQHPGHVQPQPLLPDPNSRSLRRTSSKHARLGIFSHARSLGKRYKAGAQWDLGDQETEPTQKSGQRRRNHAHQLVFRGGRECVHGTDDFEYLKQSACEPRAPH